MLLIRDMMLGASGWMDGRTGLVGIAESLQTPTRSDIQSSGIWILLANIYFDWWWVQGPLKVHQDPWSESAQISQFLSEIRTTPPFLSKFRIRPCKNRFFRFFFFFFLRFPRFRPSPCYSLSVFIIWAGLGVRSRFLFISWRSWWNQIYSLVEHWVTWKAKGPLEIFRVLLRLMMPQCSGIVASLVRVI